MIKTAKKVAHSIEQEFIIHCNNISEAKKIFFAMLPALIQKSNLHWGSEFELYTSQKKLQKF